MNPSIFLPFFFHLRVISHSEKKSKLANAYFFSVTWIEANVISTNRTEEKKNYSFRDIKKNTSEKPSLMLSNQK